MDTQLLDEAKAAGYATKVLFISTEDANLNVGRVLVRMSRGRQAVPISSVIDSYRESPKNLLEVRKHTDDLILYDNTAHRRGYRVVAQFVGGELTKTAQTIPDWAARVFGTAELGTIEAERFAANQRDRLRFNLADMSSGLFAIHKLFGRRVTEDNVGDLVECGFVRECGKGDSRRFRVRWRGPECCRSSPQTASA